MIKNINGLTLFICRERKGRTMGIELYKLIMLGIFIIGTSGILATLLVKYISIIRNIKEENEWKKRL